MKPVGKKVIIKPIDKETTTESGIEVVDVHTSKDAKGVVVAVGDAVTTIAEGQTIFYSPLTYDEFDYNKITYHVVDEDDVFAIIDKCE